MAFFVLGIPESADHVRDWVVWGGSIIGGLVAIGYGIYRLATGAKRALRASVLDVLQPEFGTINVKIDSMKVSNDIQHAQVEAAIVSLGERVDRQAEVFALHLEESAVATEQLRIVADAVNLHITALREEITSPGLPVTPGPLSPPPGPKPMF